MNIVKKTFYLIPKPIRSKRGIVIIVILLVGWNLLARGSANQSLIKTEAVKESSIKSEVTASGNISSESISTLHFAVSGKVVWVGVKKGDRVKKGQILATLDKERYEIALRQTQQDFIAAKAESEKLYDEWKGKTSETYDEKIRRTAADAKQNKAYDEFREAERNIRDTSLVAPIEGRVVLLEMKPGEDIISTTTVAKIANTDNIIFTSEIDETDIGRIREGMKAAITLDAFPDDSVSSTVNEVAIDSVTTSTGATAYEVEFSLPVRENYRLGMNGEAAILLSEVPKTLVIPIEALIDDKFVYAKDTIRFIKKEIKAGLMSDTHVEILSVLSIGDQVLVEGFEEIEKRSLLDKLLGR